MNVVYSFFVPLFCWARYGFSRGSSPGKSTTQNRGSKFLALFRKQRLGENETGLAGDIHPLQLRWAERESFFDPAVQMLLMQRHPSQTAPGRTGFKGFPIDAWKAVDQFARTAGSSERSLAEFGVFMRLDPVWISKLLSAITQAHASRPRPGYPATVNPGLENRRRERLMKAWAECWVAHYRFHDSLTESTSGPHAHCAGGR